MRESLLWITNQRLVKPAGGFPRSLAPGSSPVYNLTMTGPIVCERQRYKLRLKAYHEWKVLQQLQLHSKPHGLRFVTGSSGLTLRENFRLYISFGTSATQDTVSDLNPADEERRLALRDNKWPGRIWICVTARGKYKCVLLKTLQVDNA